MAMSPEAELGVPGSTKREYGKFAEALWDFLSLLGLLHKSYSDPSLFQEALGVLRVSHIFSFFIFYEKKMFRNFSFLRWLLSPVISLFSHITLSRPRSMSSPIPISPLSPKLNQ
jgi:hypothetical protein